MVNDREIKVVISAQDDYSAALKKFNEAVGDLSSPAQKMEAGWKKSLENIKGAWLQIGAAIASAAWLVEARKKALDAEVSFNKLSIQIENLGLSYKALTPEIETALQKTSEYARAQDEDIAKVLQQLILQTGNYRGSLINLNRVYDLSYLAGIDAGEAAVIYGKAIAGNAEGLSRIFPELKNVDDILGKNATTADKAAYAQAFLAEKVTGAREKMNEHQKAAERVHQTYKNLHQAIGNVIVDMGDELIRTIKAPITYYNSLADAIERVTHAVNPNIELSKKAIEFSTGEARAIELVGSAHYKTKEQIAAESKAKSDALDALNARMKDLKAPDLGDKFFSSLFGSTELSTGKNLKFSMERFINAPRKSELNTIWEKDSETLFQTQENLEDMMLNKHLENLNTKFAAEKEYFANRVGITQESFTALASYEDMLAEREQAGTRIRSVANQALQQQYLNLIATGKFSVSAFAQVVAQQVKVELAGIAARATIWAVYETAMGLKDLAVGMPTAAAHFASATEFATTAGMALAGAAATQAIFGGGPQQPAPGTAGGQPIITSGPAGDFPQSFSTEALQQSPVNIHLNVYTVDGADVNWQKVIDNNLGPALENYSSSVRPLSINVVKN